MINPNVTLADLNARSAYMVSLLGIEFTSIGEDFLCAKMPVDERTKQPYGVLHGGASVVLAETLASVGANLCVDTKQFACFGLEINANHLRPVSEGFVHGRAALLHAGRTTQVWEVKISNEQGKLTCVSRVTMAIVEKKG